MNELINYQEWRFQDKSKWGQGVWESEPDKCQWVDKDTGYDCLIVRNHMGNLCGYVGVKDNHPWFEKEYGFEGPDELDVHGGLTFSGHCQENNKKEGVCHITDSEDKVWWFGFDCAGCRDFVPGLFRTHKNLGISFGTSIDNYGIYRDLQYVKHQITSLAKQLETIDEFPVTAITGNGG